jgi:DNA-binding beta-propeller fold protein YncE
MLALVLAVAANCGYAADAFLPRLVNTSTVPGNGDVNPYGVAIVPPGFPGGGNLAPWDVLASNFNAAANAQGVSLQGTGTTIVQFRPGGPLAPPGSAQVFFTSGKPGLSTALGVLRAGYVIVGNVPTTDGTFNTIGQGAVQLIGRHGELLESWTDAKYLDGPWDLAVDDGGSYAHVFISNVLNGTVARIDLVIGEKGVSVSGKATIASGYTVMPNAAAVVLGPTGLAFDATTDTLYVASTADNAIYAISSASRRSRAQQRGRLVYADEGHLRGPLALRQAPSGHLLTANGDAVNADVEHPSEIVEFTTEGQFVREYNVDSSQGGAFGLDVGHGLGDYAVVDDVSNTLSVYHLPIQ